MARTIRLFIVLPLMYRHANWTWRAIASSLQHCKLTRLVSGLEALCEHLRTLHERRGMSSLLSKDRGPAYRASSLALKTLRALISSFHPRCAFNKAAAGRAGIVMHSSRVDRTSTQYDPHRVPGQRKELTVCTASNCLSASYDTLLQQTAMDSSMQPRG